MAIREMWALEYEVDELQTKFAESIGTMDLDNHDVDFIEDMMLKAKPLQSVLNCIRNRQIANLEDVKKLYADQIKDLEAMKVTRPAKPWQPRSPPSPLLPLPLPPKQRRPNLTLTSTIRSLSATGPCPCRLPDTTNASSNRGSYISYS